jgi:hypothetical protein
MATVDKAFRVKNGLVVEGATATVNTHDVITKEIFDAKGDLLVGTGSNTGTRVALGTNGYVLTADSSETNGVKWAAAPAVGAFETSIVFEGTTANDFETTLTVTDPTADRTITFPDETGTVQLRVTDVSDTEIGYLNGVTSAIQTQLDDKSTASKTETLTNKTLTTPTINGPTITDTGQTPTIHGIYLPAPHTITFEGTTANDFETILTAGEPTGDRTITLPDATGTVQLRVADVEDAEIAHLNGVTSAIQTQIDNKASLSGATFTGAVSGTSLTLSGDLTVNGTTTTINSTEITIDDKNLVLGSVATPTDAGADGGGITLKGATDKTLNWIDATDSWTSSEHVNLASGKELKINGTSVLSGSTLGSGVTGSSLTSVGTISSGTWNGTAIAVANGGTGATDSGTARTNLGLAIGTDVQAYNSTLAAVAGGTYTGDDSITTVGTISAGTWNGSTIAVANGGTGITSFGTGIATFLGTPSSANLLAAVTDETGTGALVFANTPTLVTPVIGAATGTSLSLSGALTATAINFDNTLVGSNLATAGTETTNIDAWAVATYSSAKYIVQMKKGTDIEVLEVLVTVDGNNNVYLTEYADVISNTQLGTTNAVLSGGNVVLQVTAAANDTSVKVHKIYIEA